MSLQHILKNSSVSGKEPLASQLANGELSINYHADGPFLCCKDTAGNVRRVAGVWVSATAPSTPFPGELWLDTSSTPTQLKVYKDTTDAWVFAGEVNTATTTTEGLVRLATNAEAQGGISTTSAVTPASLQSKISDSTSTVSSTTIASSTAVKNLADTVNAALPKSGGTITGTLEIGNTGQLRFEGSSNDAYETTLAVEDPTGTRTITLPDRTGTVITTGDTGTVTSTMIADSTIVNADINASAAIAHSKLAALNSAQVLLGNASNVPTATTVTGDVTISNAGVTSIASGVIVDADINSDAEIAVSKLADGTSRQLLQTDTDGTGVEWTSNVDIPGTLDVTGATTLDSTLSVSGNVGIGTSSPNFALHVVTSGAGEIRHADGIRAVAIGSTGSLSYIGSMTSGQDLALYAANGEKVRIASSGNVGIGTSLPGQPGQKLEISGEENPTFRITTSKSDDAWDTSAEYGKVQWWSTDFEYGGGGEMASVSAGVNTTFGGHGYLKLLAGPNGSIRFWANSAERMRLTSDGRLGIGTSSPTEALSVTGNIALTTSEQATITVGNGSQNGPHKVDVRSGGFNIDFGYYLNGTRRLYSSSSDGNVTSIACNASSYIRFINGTSEVARLDGSGRVLVNTSNAIGGTHGLQVVGNSGVQSAQILMRHPDASSGEFWQIGPDNGNNNFVVYNHAAVGLYITNGQNSWTSSSDERLKTDLVNIEDGLAKVSALRAVTGRLKTDPEGTSKSFLIAQDVLSVFPEPVDTQNPDKLGLAYTEMIPLLVAALKESKERIETLEAKVAALEVA